MSAKRFESSPWSSWGSNTRRTAKPVTTSARSSRVDEEAKLRRVALDGHPRLKLPDHAARSPPRGAPRLGRHRGRHRDRSGGRVLGYDPVPTAQPGRAGTPSTTRRLPATGYDLERCTGTYTPADWRRQCWMVPGVPVAGRHPASGRASASGHRSRRLVAVRGGDADAPVADLSPPQRRARRSRRTRCTPRGRRVRSTTTRSSPSRCSPSSRWRTSGSCSAVTTLAQASPARSRCSPTPLASLSCPFRRSGLPRRPLGRGRRTAPPHRLGWRHPPPRCAGLSPAFYEKLETGHWNAYLLVQEKYGHHLQNPVAATRDSLEPLAHGLPFDLTDAPALQTRPW